MTIEINLLPWREEERARRSKRFFMALALMALLGLGGGYGATWYYEQRLADQQQRHQLINSRTAELDRDLRAVSQYQEQLNSLKRQIEVFEQLQMGRPQTVHVFNALAASLEEGVYYTRLNRQGSQLRLTGLAEDNRRVSDQLRQLEASPVFDVPVLSEVETAESEMRRFNLSVNQQMPNGEGTEAP
ncbi:PilN domain-containing protein [Halomonas lysinitropha]|uniref:Fimbrial assembly protein (PilN) n=1 Tax=Halomonas lysinitropha TaxID=2607506 RepID=A0A5K1I9T7_9GAMM|nr:PilN domain-containing protein [Halomonas lysinitropha]VVZ95882.1 Fimbrial assembly protein (PilN) [Halomonas lysinitropha]